MGLILLLKTMHPLVRDLYKRVVIVGKDYPLGMDYVRKTWKMAIFKEENCPSCYNTSKGLASPQCEREIRLAVGKGRHMVNEMIGVIQLKKYRTMKKRYSWAKDNNDDDVDDNDEKKIPTSSHDLFGRKSMAQK